MQDLIRSTLKKYSSSKKSSLLGKNLSIWQKTVMEDQLPTRKQEEWKYTDLSFLKEYKSFKEESRLHTISFNKAKNKIIIDVADQGAKDVEVKGDLPAGVECFVVNNKSPEIARAISLTLKNNWKHKNYFSNLRYSFGALPLVLRMTKEFNGEPSIEINFKNGAKNKIEQPHIVVLVDGFVTAKIVENINLSEGSFVNSGVDYYLAPMARVQLLKKERGSGRGCHTARFTLKKDAFLDLVTLNSGGKWSRHNLYVELKEAGAEAHLQAAYLLSKKQFVDHHTTIEHQVEHTQSSQTYNGILSGHAEAVFNGQVNILRYAQKSSSAQLNRNLLLSKHAKVNTKPELQIDADDVTATHGATAGQIQESEVFYMQSRGIPEKQARTMLSKGFALEIGQNLSEELRQQYIQQVDVALEKVFEEQDVL